MIIGDGISSRDIFVPGQLFPFGGIVLHANSAGRLDQFDSFAPKH